MDVHVFDYTVHNSAPLLCGLDENGTRVAVQVAHLPFAIFIEPPYHSDKILSQRNFLLLSELIGGGREGGSGGGRVYN